jgi:hypothetical protein
MTDQPDPKKQPDSSGNTTNDLRDAAREARELFEAAQAAEGQKSAQPLESLPDDGSNGADDDSGSETSVIPIAPEDMGNTTNDLAQEAYKALQIEQMAQSLAQEAEAAQAFDPATMNLELHMVDMPDSIVKTVDGELVVGRADSVTHYMPDIDLTPFGAYRLGLSRRHATILAQENTLLVKDLQSRNGTFVNGKAVPKGGTHPLRNGDSVRFGNLTLQIRFQHNEEA